MAGTAARASIAKSAANSINFFIFSYLRLYGQSFCSSGQFLLLLIGKYH
jgi:hypothetical protein